MEAILLRTGCGQLLDLHNLYCNAVNFGLHPAKALSRVSMDHVGEFISRAGRGAMDFTWSAHTDVCQRQSGIFWKSRFPACGVLPRLFLKFWTRYLERLSPDAIAQELERARNVWQRYHQTPRPGHEPLVMAFRSDLGRALLGEDTCPIDSQSPRFSFHDDSQALRWCEGRSIMAARGVLRLMPTDDRERLVCAYVNEGGGLAWFQATESERFLAFLARNLPEPSHALTICRISQALAQARLGRSTIVPPGKQVEGGPVNRGPHAALVWFYADPDAVMEALNGSQLPPVGPPSPWSPFCARNKTSVSSGDRA